MTAAPDTRFGNWLGMPDGHRFYPLDPRVREVRIEDIAHALAGTCRWGGRCDPWYSVAQHSLHVMAIVERTRPDLALHALLHDAAEAYLGDIPTPLKESMWAGCHGGAVRGIQFVEFDIMECVHEAFGMALYLMQTDVLVIKVADRVALATEARDLMGDPEWARVVAVAETSRIEPLAPPAAKRAFLAAFKRLRGEACEV